MPTVNWCRNNWECPTPDVDCRKCNNLYREDVDKIEPKEGDKK
jgi:hypothetical protein